jgi:DNA-binding Lrp family transcriptional regulator
LATSYLLINTGMGAENEVLESIKEIPNVKEAHSVNGEYDIIARVEGKTMEELKNIISWKIRRHNKVKSTRTMIVV